MGVQENSINIPSSFMHVVNYSIACTLVSSMHEFTTLYSNDDFFYFKIIIFI